VAFTTLYSLFGSAAPALWLVTARAGAFAALVLAYRLGARLGGVVAGVAATVGLALTTSSVRYFAGGAAEPLLVAVVLGAVERHLAGRRGQALALGFAASLLRPECLPFLGLYVLYLYWRRPLRLAAVAVLLALVPVCWLLPEKIGAGDWFHGAKIATMSKEAHQIQAVAHPALTSLWRCLTLAPVPIALAAAFALVLAARRRQLLPLVLGAWALAWFVLVAGMTAGGYAGLPRFALPAAALVCVLGGAGIAELTKLAPERRRAFAVAAIVLISLPFAYVRGMHDTHGGAGAATRARLENELPGLVSSLGGHKRVAGCGVVTIDGTFSTAFAWYLHVATTALDPVHPPQLSFRTDRRVLTGFEGRVREHRYRAGRDSIVLIHRGGWRVIANGRCKRLRPVISAAAGT
jgi:hypothetical protein